MSGYEIFWLPFDKEHPVILQFGYECDQQLPVLIDRTSSNNTKGTKSLTFGVDNIIMGMLLAIAQSNEELQGLIQFDKQRAVSALRHVAKNNDDPICDRMLHFAIDYMKRRNCHVAESTITHVAHVYFGLNGHGVIN